LARRDNKYGAKVIKFCGTGGVLSKGTKIGAQQFSFEEMKAIVDEAHLLGLKVAVHAHGKEGIETAIRAGVDSVEHASLISDEGLRAGVNLAFGSDAGVYPHGQNGRQFAYLVDWGLTSMEAIQASTIKNADLFGIAEDRGSIAVGKRADIIAVNDNPLDNIRALEDVDFVMKDGVIYKDK